MVQFVGSSQLGYTSSQFGQTATQVTARRHVRLHLKRIRDREYCKLRELIPSVAAKKKVSKVQVIEEAVRYIEELHSTLMDRLRHKHGDQAEDKAQETVQYFMDQMTTLPPVTLSSQLSSPAPRPSPSLQLSSSQHRAPLRTPDGSLLMRFTSGDFEKQRKQPSFLMRKSR